MDYKSCRADEGGASKCKLGLSCNSVEIRGSCLSSILKSKQKNKPSFQPGEYLKTYSYLFILNTPGYYDDKYGYIGNDKTFDKLINFVYQARINPDDVYVTYRIKCKIPKGRKATKAELEACLTHLRWEIEKFNPKVIMTFGADCLRLIKRDNTDSILSVRGTVIKAPMVGLDKIYTFIPALDPNIFLINPDEYLEKRVISDFVLAKKVVDGTYDPNTTGHSINYQVISSLQSLDQMISEIQEKKFFSFDTESRSLPWTKEPIICISFCWGYGEPNRITTAVLPIYNHDPLGLDWKLKSAWPDSRYLQTIFHRLKSILESPIPKAAFNAKYDINVLKKHCGINTQGFIYDPMLMHHLLNEYPPHDLEYLADVEFHVGNYSFNLKKIVGFGNKKKPYDLVPDNIMWPYTCLDAENTFRLAQLYYSRMQQKPHLWKLYCEEVEPAIWNLGRSEWKGVLLDTNAIDTLYIDYSKELDEKLLSLRSKTNPDFNPSSPDQIVEIIKKTKYKDKIINTSKAKGYETSKQVLLELAEDGYELAEEIVSYRNLRKMISTYLVNAKNYMDSDGRLRIPMKIHGTENSRYSDYYTHQIPRTDKNKILNIRDIFIAPEGKNLIHMDFEQIELRLFAIQSNDPEMLKLFQEGKDIHRATGASFLGMRDDEVSDFNRQEVGKKVNFALIYGSEGYKVIKTGVWQDEKRKTRPLNWDIFNKGMARWKDRFPNAAQYLVDVPEIARSNGGVWITPFGRERHMGERLNSSNEYERKAAEREIVNNSIQSPAGQILNRTLNLLYFTIIDQIKKGNISDDDIIQILTVHDSSTYEVTDYLTNWWVDIVKRIAERPIPELKGYSFPIKIGIGKSWAKAEIK